jgi:hypothetical protein
VVEAHRLAIILPTMTIPDIHDVPSPAPVSRFAHERAELHTRLFWHGKRLPSIRVYSPSDV